VSAIAHATDRSLARGVVRPHAGATEALPLRELLRRDWSRHGGSWGAFGYVSFWVVVSYRLSHALTVCRLDILGQIVQLAACWIFRCDISRKAVIGPELVVSHPCAVFIGPHCRIGRRFTVGAAVFIGSNINHRDPADYPTIGDSVNTGPGARIMGPVVIGDEVNIGPNVVVVRSVPPRSVVLPPTCHVMQREAWNGFKADARRTETAS
jgi:serine O-acetyltransferase